MVCLHCMTPIPVPIQGPIPMELGVIIFLRTVYSGPIPIPTPMQMGTVPNLTQISVPIRWFLSNFHSHHQNKSQCNLSAYYRNWNQNKNRHRSRAV